jgi:hypothetical protein
MILFDGAVRLAKQQTDLEYLVRFSWDWGFGGMLLLDGWTSKFTLETSGQTELCMTVAKEYVSIVQTPHALKLCLPK